MKNDWSIEWSVASQEQQRLLISKVSDELLFEKCKVVPLVLSDKEREQYIDQVKKEILSDIEFEKRIKGARLDPPLRYQKLGTV